MTALAVSLIIYCVLHSILADADLMGRIYTFWWYRLFYVAQSLVLLAFPLYFYYMLPDIYVFYPPLVWRVLLYAVWFSALAFGAYAAASYDNMNFLGLSQINNYMMNKEKNFNPHGDLTMKGALRYVRHPYYFVALVLIWSRPLKEKDLVLNAVLTVYFILGTLNEERKLRKHFGKEYEEYAKKVPMLIPFLNRLF